MPTSRAPSNKTGVSQKSTTLGNKKREIGNDVTGVLFISQTGRDFVFNLMMAEDLFGEQRGKYADCYISEHARFGEGSVMIWTGVSVEY